MVQSFVWERKTAEQVELGRSYQRGLGQVITGILEVSVSLSKLPQMKQVKLLRELFIKFCRASGNILARWRHSALRVYCERLDRLPDKLTRGGPSAGTGQEGARAGQCVKDMEKDWQFTRKRGGP